MSTNKKSLISVLVAIYNVEKYLPQCIDSILTQTYHNLEIVLVDDGSTDNSGKICDEYAAKDSRVKVIHKKNGGLVSARNAGLDVATGKYIGFVDGDDWIEPQTYQIAFELMQQHNVDIVKWGKTKVVQNTITPVKLSCKPGVYKGAKLSNILENIIKGQNLDPNIVLCLFKKEIIDSYHLRVPVGVDQGEDLYFSTLYLLHAHSLFVNSQLYFYNYRQNPASLTKRFTPIYLTKLEKFIRYYSNLLSTGSVSERYYQAFCQRMNSMIFYALFVCADFQFCTFSDRILELKEFYRRCQVQFQVASNYNTIPRFKRIPVILFHKHYFYTALIISYILKTIYLCKEKIQTWFHIGGILCFR